MKDNLTLCTQFIFLKTSLIFCLLFITYCIILFNKEKTRDLFKFELNFFFFNWVYIYIYIFGYFAVVIYIRIYYINYMLDLKPLINKLKIFCINKPFIDLWFLIIIGSLSFILFIIIMFFIHRFFIKQLLKRFLILTPFLHYKKFTNYGLYAIENIIDSFWMKLVAYIAKHVNLIFEKELTMRRMFLSINKFLLFVFPTIFLFMFFLYDLNFNDYVLSKNFFKYLLFYVIFSIYKRLSIFLETQDSFINKMLYNIYYKKKSILYVNIPDHLEQIVYNYVDSYLYVNPYQLPKELDDFSFYHAIITEHIFRSTDGFLYKNNTDQFFYEKNNKNYDVVLYNYEKLKKLYIKLNQILFGNTHKTDGIDI